MSGSSWSMPAPISMHRSIFRRMARPPTGSTPAAFVVPLAVVDVTEQAAKNSDYQMTRADLECLREEARPHSRQCLRRDAFRLGALRRRRREIHRQGRGRRLSTFPGVSPDAAQWLMTERKGAGACGRYAVARSRRVEGFQDALSVAAVRPLGSGECRESRSGAGCGRDARGRRAKVKDATGGTGAADRAGVSRSIRFAKERSPGPFRDPGLSASRHVV